MMQDELAVKLGVTKGTISKYKARGCPLDDEGKARTWIRANIKARRKSIDAVSALKLLATVDPATHRVYPG
jgi:hypothetical protein